MSETNVAYHFYRCKSCTALLTADEEKRAYTDGKFCACGGVKYSPTNPNDAEWDTPKVKAYCDAHDLQRDVAEVA